MEKLGAKAKKNVTEMMDMLVDFSKEVSCQRSLNYVILSAKLIEKSTGQPCVLYCMSSVRDLTDLVMGVWEAYKASTDFPFSVEKVRKDQPRTMYHHSVITGKKPECYRFATYVDTSQIQYFLEEETYAE